MIGLILSLALMSVPEPRPYQDAVPSDTFRRASDDGKTVSWRSRPSRQTQFWRSSGLLYCDDPSCSFCGPHVYPAVHNGWKDNPIRR